MQVPGKQKTHIKDKKHTDKKKDHIENEKLITNTNGANKILTHSHNTPKNADKRASLNNILVDLDLHNVSEVVL